MYIVQHFFEVAEQLLRQLFIFRIVQYYIILSEYCTQKYIITAMQLHINVLRVGNNSEIKQKYFNFYLSIYHFTIEIYCLLGFLYCLFA